MAKLACLVALVLLGLTDAGVITSVGIPATAFIGGPAYLSAGYGSLGFYGAPILSSGVVAPAGSILSNPAHISAAAAPGIDTGIDSVGPKDATLVNGGTTIIRGPSATLIASPGAIQSGSSTGANLNSIGGQVAPASGAVIVPASATAIVPGGPIIICK